MLLVFLDPFGICILLLLGDEDGRVLPKPGVQMPVLSESSSRVHLQTKKSNSPPFLSTWPPSSSSLLQLSRIHVSLTPLIADSSIQRDTSCLCFLISFDEIAIKLSLNSSSSMAQLMEDLTSSSFVVTIANFTKLGNKYYSQTFQLDGYNWRVLIYPNGNNVDHLSIYLDVADAADMPHGWSIHAQLGLTVVNQVHTHCTLQKNTLHKFNAEESDWGFTKFMPLSDLYDPVKRYLVNDTLIVEVAVASRYDSKVVTGYVGLENEGQTSTSYMNSLIQILYHIPYFRKAVYQMPTTKNGLPSRLQNLLYELQHSRTCVATKELTHSFGCNTRDVQVLSMVLNEKLEDLMKGTVADGTMQHLFEGHHTTYIECINVNYNSTRTRSFYDLQLDVKGCPDVYASFDKYVKVECREGDNKYHTGENGLQDARKAVRFFDFPPVLRLQLKRFEYDSACDTMIKINDQYEFPLDLDLDKDNGKYLSPVADRRVRNLFTLHSVLVHSGGEHGGRCHAFIRPTLSNQWFKFDDQTVTKEDKKRALEEQYGGEEEMNAGLHDIPLNLPKYSNPHMLVYVRKNDMEKIFCNIGEEDFAEHLRVRLKKEKEETEHKEREAWFYTTIKVALDEDLVQQVGKNIYFDLVDHDKVRYFRIQKQMPFSILKEEVAKEFGIPVQFQRYWLWAKRQNDTYRPSRPLTPEEETQTVGQFQEVSKKANNAELKLLLEIEIGPDLHPIRPPEMTRDDIMIFFKLYDPIKAELRYVGRLFVKSCGLPSEILTKLNVMAGFPFAQNLELYEEIKFTPSVMCESIDKKLTFRASQLENGDIVCFQKSPESGQQYLYPDVTSFFEYVHNRREEVAMEFGIPVQFQRFWLWAKRQNNTYRPHRPLTSVDETQSVGQFREVSCKDPNAELKLFLEVNHGLDSRPVQLPEMREDDILIFFKLYDPVKEELRYVGRLLVKSTSSPSKILTKLNEMAGFSSSQEILLYEEIKFDPSVMCEPINKSLTFRASQLQNGDIVCFQKSPAVGSVQQCRYPLIPSFLEYMLNRQVVHFHPLEKPKEDSFSLELSKRSVYHEVVGRVACKLGIYDPSRIRLTIHDFSSQKPKPTHIMCGDTDKLSDILVDRNQRASHILYYEILEDKSESSSSAQNRPSTCVICFVAPTEGACIPCGHMACCMSCLSEIKGKEWGCPVCRAQVEQIVKIFAV